MRPQSQMKWRADPNFASFKFESRELLLRRDIESHAARIIQRLGDLRTASEGGAGNRRSGFRIILDDGLELFARRCRRGGMVASLLGDVYVGISPRPFDELGITLEAMRRGIPVAEPMGAMVEWLAPVLYRGFFLTRVVRGMTLWEVVRTDDDPTVRHVLEQTRASIAKMHDKGLFHADLNLHNLIVTRAGESFAVTIIDLDKARLFDQPLSPAMRRSNLARLMRSARKLDPSGQFLDTAALSILNPE